MHHSPVGADAMASEDASSARGPMDGPRAGDGSDQSEASEKLPPTFFLNGALKVEPKQIA
jgi:hypothetical protein